MTWRSVKFLWLSLWAVSLVVALAIPVNPFSYPILQRLVSGVGAIVPGVYRHATFSPISDVVKVYWATMWMLVVVWLPFYFKLTDEQIRPLEKVKKHPKGFVLLPLAILLVIVEWYYLPIVIAPGKVSQLFHSTRLGLGIMAGAAFSSIPLLIRFLPLWYRYLPKVRT